MSLGREFLSDQGSMFVRCDCNGNMYVRLLLNDIFGEDNFRNEISINRVKKQTSETASKLTKDLDSLFIFSNNFEEKIFFKFPTKKIDRVDNWHAADTQGKYEAKFFFGKKIFPPTKNRGWFSQEKIILLEKSKEIR